MKEQSQGLKEFLLCLKVRQVLRDRCLERRGFLLCKTPTSLIWEGLESSPRSLRRRSQRMCQIS